MSDQAILARLCAIEDRNAIQDAICAVTINSDLDHPDQALAQFAEDAMIDYASVLGVDAAHTPARKHRERLLTFLPGFNGRQHQVTNFQVHIDGDQASCISQVRAVHILAGEVWEAWCTYHHKLRRTTDGWKITYQRADLIHQTGEHLVPKAAAIVARRAGGP